CNMQLYAALGAAIFMTTGSGPKMFAACTSALEIAEIVDDPDYRLRALWGLYADRITSGHVREALAVAERFLTYAVKTNDPADRAIGDRLVGLALLVLGDLEGARRHVERMLDRYVARRSHLTKYQFDQALLARMYQSLVLWLQGFADQAMRSVECQVVNARADNHPISLSNILLQSACPVTLLAGDLTSAEGYARELMDLSAKHAMPLWSVVGRFFLGVLLVKRGDIGVGLELLRATFTQIPAQNIVSHVSILYPAHF